MLVLVFRRWPYELIASVLGIEQLAWLVRLVLVQEALQPCARRKGVVRLWEVQMERRGGGEMRDEREREKKRE